MNRSVSARHVREYSRSPSKRGLYINTQMNKREKNTTFHSPYKDGRPNKDYINPSFISSHLFYPKEYLQNKNIAVQPNYLLNSNDIQKETLYRQRTRTEVELQQRQKSAKSRQREYLNVKNNIQRTGREKSPQKQLVRQLQNLRVYHNHNEQQRKQRNPHEEVPIYLQQFIKQHKKLRRDNQYEMSKQTHRQREMREWIQLTSELKQIKKDMKQSNRAIEIEKFNRQIQENALNHQEQERQRRKESQILGSILRQQMRWDRQRRLRNA